LILRARAGVGHRKRVDTASAAIETLALGRRFSRRYPIEIAAGAAVRRHHRSRRRPLGSAVELTGSVEELWIANKVPIVARDPRSVAELVDLLCLLKSFR
jgi:hypothetical protein